MSPIVQFTGQKLVSLPDCYRAVRQHPAAAADRGASGLRRAAAAVGCCLPTGATCCTTTYFCSCTQHVTQHSAACALKQVLWDAAFHQAHISCTVKLIDAQTYSEFSQHTCSMTAAAAKRIRCGQSAAGRQRHAIATCAICHPLVVCWVQEVLSSVAAAAAQVEAAFDGQPQDSEGMYGCPIGPVTQKLPHF